MRLTPNAVTLFGLPIALLVALCIAQGSFLLGASLFLLLGGCDLLDGYIAKTRNLATPFGAFLDSSVDRVTDFILFFGILFFYLKEGDDKMVFVTGWALGGPFLVSYTRARAEKFIPSCRVGFWERPERIGLLLVGLVFGRLEMALWILAVGTTLTALHRVLYTQRTLSGKPFRFPLLFPDYPRKSLPYWLYVAGVACIVLFVKLK